MPCIRGVQGLAAGNVKLQAPQAGKTHGIPLIHADSTLSMHHRFERYFRLAGQTVCVREVGVEEGGLGHCVWDAGVALSIWLSRNAASTVKGQRVMELGSGVGISGIAALRAGASSAVLSDFTPQGEASRASGQEDTTRSSAETQAATLLANLPRNAALSGLSAASVTTMGLDWNDCLDSKYTAAER